MSEQQEKFTYNYSAKQQQELERIREKYAPKDKTEDKMEQIRRLDESTTKPGTVISILAGVIGTLLLGIGMCCTMVWTDMFVLGVVIGIVGIAVVAMAYPLYSHITKKQREKIAPTILQLTDELRK
ncbi:MAG: hypothetical protein NC299_17490 [Lachnospiraceae bacterium]|nr:hypothetical protein [Ruminococcus sp.]MCM1277126.1 hypothetical protein [Lachnospiraceae bacterium]